MPKRWALRRSSARARPCTRLPPEGLATTIVPGVERIGFAVGEDLRPTVKIPGMPAQAKAYGLLARTGTEAHALHPAADQERAAAITPASWHFRLETSG